MKMRNPKLSEFVTTILVRGLSFLWRAARCMESPTVYEHEACLSSLKARLAYKGERGEQNCWNKDCIKWRGKAELAVGLSSISSSVSHRPPSDRRERLERNIRQKVSLQTRGMRAPSRYYDFRGSERSRTSFLSFIFPGAPSQSSAVNREAPKEARAKTLQQPNR